MNYGYLLAKFLAGGGIVLAVTLLANYVHPKWGGLIIVAPITTTLSVLFLHHEVSIGAIQKTVLGAIYFILPLLVFLGLLYLLLNKYHLYVSLSIAYVVWFISIVSIQYFFLK